MKQKNEEYKDQVNQNNKIVTELKAKVQSQGLLMKKLETENNEAKKFLEEKKKLNEQINDLRNKNNNLENKSKEEIKSKSALTKQRDKLSNENKKLKQSIEEYKKT